MTQSQAQKNIARSFNGEGPLSNVVSAPSASSASGPAPVPAGLILQSFFINVPTQVLTGPTTGSSPITGATQPITTVAGSKLRVTVMHGIFLNAAGGANAQIGIEINVDAVAVGIVLTPSFLPGISNPTSGSVMYQAPVAAGLHTVQIARTLQNAVNTATIDPNYPLQILVEEISG